MNHDHRAMGGPPMAGDAHDETDAAMPTAHKSLWQTRGGIVLIGFLAVAGFYLVTEHTAHVFGALPWLLILGCLLMHLFMHHGHGGSNPPEGGKS